jgi:hypothetical protein
MTKNALLKKLDAVMTDVERSRMYGEINIVVRNGEATVLRTMKSEQLDAEKHSQNHAETFNR